MVDRLLIANRGEIAVRVIRAARMLEMETYSIHSEQDNYSLHVRLSDEAISLGSGPARDNYLNIEKILDIARRYDIDAIHPGYGFLSESAEFAQKIIDAGIIWIGPPPEALIQLGDKLQSREAAQEVGVPITPGTDNPVEAEKSVLKTAKKIGYPVMAKAAFGGGGLGMQVVWSEDNLLKAIKQTKRQAEAAFGKSDIFLEKYVEKPRHIEIQFMADSKGNVVHLGERECSIQRRHQKLIEEAPSPVITEEERNKIGRKVKKLVRLVGYENAGTVEFLYKDGEFYFNEVNARLQVEHPVTEMVTGKDIVVEQLRVASGKRLSWKQKDIEMKGHAFEFRINAEDPLNDFNPSPGIVENLNLPGGMGVRFDTHIYENYRVPTDYDSLLGKLIIWGEDRTQSIFRAYYALSELAITGFPTNMPFHRVVLASKEFHQANISTNFIADTQLVPYIREAFNRRLAALITTGIQTSKVFLPSRHKSRWRETARQEGIGKV